jgi:hypothetical protein
MGLGKSEMAARSVQPPAACSTPAGISDQSHRNPHCANVGWKNMPSKWEYIFRRVSPEE